MKKIVLIHGPNLNQLGKRQPEIYGGDGIEKLLNQLKDQHTDIDYYQSNIEGELINYLQDCKADGIIINAGGYAHTSVALADAVAAIDIPVINVHISNIYMREKERHKELLAQYCIAGVYGMGFEGYSYALQFLLNQD